MKQPMLINRPFFDTAIKNDKDYMEKIKDLYKPNPLPSKYLPVFDVAMHRLNMNILQKAQKERRKLDRECFTGKKDRRAKER